MESKTQRATLGKFAEIALTFCLTAFIATATLNVSITICAVITGTAVISKVSHLAGRYLHPEAKDLEDADPFEWGQPAARFSAINLSMLAGPGILIHEAGHALASLALFKKADPIISITPFKGGSTSHVSSYGLTALGAKIGKPASKVVVAAGGIIASTCFAAGSFVLAEKIKASHPKVAELLEWMGISQIVADVLYGLNAFLISKTRRTHDFIFMWVNGGIHPLVPIALMLTIPLVCKVWAAQKGN